ncbi:hypothetical protein [Caloranaerobacter sp. DY30410]|uniref:hypothetical protein n=1 Tax=Caloranaerobacter sp. DY30410 TaxID=3238305 RepID=UPI003CFE4D09
MLHIVFGFLLATFSILACLIITVFIILAVFCTPYWLYLGVYKHQHNLPDDFRKTNSVFKETKYAAKFYWDLLHLRKPTF